MCKADLAILTSIVRLEEKSLFSALEERGKVFDQINLRNFIMSLDEFSPGYRIVINRSISQIAGRLAVSHFEKKGARCMNSSAVIDLCGDKALTTAALAAAGIPVPRTMVALSPDAALTAIETIGYPAVLKPTVGSWGRLIAKVTDRFAAEALIEHRSALPSIASNIYYIQEYISKPGRDIRVIFIGSKIAAAYYRYSDHWITNVARGAHGMPCPVHPSLVDLASAVAQTIGGDFLGIDLLERPDGSLVVNEVNHTLEFIGAASTTGVDIAGVLVDYVLDGLA